MSKSVRYRAVMPALATRSPTVCASDTQLLWEGRVSRKKGRNGVWRYRELDAPFSRGLCEGRYWWPVSGEPLYLLVGISTDRMQLVAAPIRPAANKPEGQDRVASVFGTSDS
jgi:hypothetical protein